MRKIIGYLIIIMAVGVVIFNACGTREAIAVPSDIAARLAAEITMPRGVMVTDENAADTGQLIYALMGADFDPDMFDGYAVYPPVVNDTAAEFGILKVRDSADIADAEKLIRTRIDKIRKSFEYDLPEKYEIRTDGKYVFYSMAKDNSKVFDIINEMLNDK